MERLKYHQASLDFIGEIAVFSQKNTEELSQFERECNIKLPLSLIEWYSLERGQQILHRYSNGDHPVPASKLKTDYLVMQGYESEKYYAPFETHNLLPVMHENQGCFDWLVYLNGSDDPPVYVTGETLELFTNTFSDFIYTHVWDWNGLFSNNWHCLYTNPGEVGLAFMRLHFQETTRTFSFDYIGGAAYRFFQEDKCVLIKTGTDYNTWHVWASSYENLIELINTLADHIRFRYDIQEYQTNYASTDDLKPEDIPF